MLKIYDGEVFSIDVNQYNRVQILQKCWNLGNCEDMKFLLYDEERVVGSLSYYNILYQENVDMKTLLFSERVFADGRNYFSKRISKEGDFIPIINAQGECLFLLVFCENKSYDILKNGVNIEAFWDLDFSADEEYLDYTLLNRANGYVFFELEEYTYEIASLIRRKFPDKDIWFYDKNASYFFDDKFIINSLRELEAYVGKLMYIGSESNVGKPMYIDSESNRKKGVPEIPNSLSLIYNSLEVVKSLVWCKNIKISSYKQKCEKNIYVIDYPTWKSGLVDIIRFTCAHIMMAEERGLIPYVCLNRYPNQYLENEQDNMWEYFFENITDISENDLKTNTVISAYESNILLDPHSDYNVYVKEKHEILWETMNNAKIFNSYIKLKKDVMEQITSLMPVEFNEKRILGVLARGTDFREEAVKARDDQFPSASSIENLMKNIDRALDVWGYEYIFVATEDKEYYELLEKKYGDKMLSISQERVYFKEANMFVCDLFENTDKKLLAVQYMASVYCLSKCQGFLANKVCGALFLAYCWNNGEYEFDKVI